MGEYSFENAPYFFEEGDLIDKIYRVDEDLTKNRTGGGNVYRVFHREWDIDMIMKTPKINNFMSERIDFYIKEYEEKPITGLCLECIPTLHAVIMSRF